MIPFILYLLVGTYTSGTSEGIYAYQFNTETGESTYTGMVKVGNPSYLTPNADHTFIYSVSESDGSLSSASALTFDKTNGALRLINSQEAKGSGPCNIAIDPQEKFVVTANYGGGSISVFPIQADGSLAPVSQVIQFEGHSVDKSRQKSPHLHCVLFSPDGKYLFAADLGTDKLYRMNIGYQPGTAFIDQASLTSVEIAAGSGPRHFVFHPSNKYAYLINELGGTVTSFTYKKGQLKTFQTIEADSLNAQGSADIRITPDGRFLYASNRLKGDGLAIFAIHPSNGKLTKVGYQPTGIHPRNFTITPNGKFLLAACRDSHLIQVFAIDPATGLLTDTHQDIHLNMPVCLKLIP